MIKTFRCTYYQPDIYCVIDKLPVKLSKEEFDNLILSYWNGFEFTNLIKNDLDILRLLKQKSVPIFYVIHFLFGTIIKTDWFDGDLFVDVCKYLDEGEIHLMYEIFSYLPDIFTRKEELKNIFKTKKDLNSYNNYYFFVHYLQYFKLTEKEENEIVQNFYKRKLSKHYLEFDKLNIQYKSSRNILRNIIFINKLKKPS